MQWALTKLLGQSMKTNKITSTILHHPFQRSELVTLLDD